jgi:quinol monooxygenase YgiN
VLIVVFKLTCQPEKTTEVGDALRRVIAASRALDGVVSFDIASDLADPNGFVATEVFEDQAARDRQESLPEVAAVMALLPTSLAGPPDLATYSAD